MVTKYGWLVDNPSPTRHMQNWQQNNKDQSKHQFLNGWLKFGGWEGRWGTRRSPVGPKMSNGQSNHWFVKWPDDHVPQKSENPAVWRQVFNQGIHNFFVQLPQQCQVNYETSVYCLYFLNIFFELFVLLRHQEFTRNECNDTYSIQVYLLFQNLYEDDQESLLELDLETHQASRMDQNSSARVESTICKKQLSTAASR